MPRLSRLIVPAALLVLAGACTSEPTARMAYGAWKLESIQGDSTRGHVVGETLLLSPDGVAIFSAPGREARKLPFKGFVGQDAFVGSEEFMISFEGEPAAWLLQMQTRNDLRLTTNEEYAAVLTFRRER
jgi:hypothetical protein